MGRESGAVVHVFSVTLFPPELPACPAEWGDGAEDGAPRSAGSASERERTSSTLTEDQLPDFVRDSLPRLACHAPGPQPCGPPSPPAATRPGPRQRSSEVLEKLSLARNALLSNLAVPHPSSAASSASPASASGLQPSSSLLKQPAPMAPHTCVAMRDAPNALRTSTQEKQEAITTPRATPVMPAAPSITSAVAASTFGPPQQHHFRSRSIDVRTAAATGAELAQEGRTHGDETGVRLQAAVQEAVALVAELGKSLSFCVRARARVPVRVTM